MVVECVLNMAASNTLSTVNGYADQRHRRAGGAAGVSSSDNNALLSFQCPNHGEPQQQDSARLLGHGNGVENFNNKNNQQCRADFLCVKDASRRKRVNRSAKLKQHKLDARREQWLSQGSQGTQGKQGKGDQEQQNHRNCEQHHKTGDGECTSHDTAGPSGSSRRDQGLNGGSVCERGTSVDALTAGVSSEPKNLKKEAPLRKQESGSSRAAATYFRDEELQEHNKKQELMTTNGRSICDMSNKSGSNSSCASSSYTGSASEEDNDESHDAEDDWESAFDALHVQSLPHRSEGSYKGPSSDRVEVGKKLQDKKQNGAYHCIPHHADMLQNAPLKPEYKYRNSGFGGRRGSGGRAWRPDDVSRPPTLPRLTKQHTYPNHSSNNNSHQGWGTMWVSNNHHHHHQQPAATPSYCPICTEELDLTDSSYMPCTCGFQLCLFCYHRISSDDGRCPGCRKVYNPDSAVKLSRSSSVWLRV